MRNILSIDLESWVHFYSDALGDRAGLADSAGRKAADSGYIREAAEYILDALDRYGRTATFFVVVEIQRWYPGLIDAIKRRGHEIGYHSDTHDILKQPGELAKNLKRSAAFLKKYRPKGYRAPMIVLFREDYPDLKKAGFTYSSSTYYRHGEYDMDGITEIPVATAVWSGGKDGIAQMPQSLTLLSLFRKLPFGSGLFLAIFRGLSSLFIRRRNRRGNPAVLFFHPWQLFRHPKIHSASFRLRAFFRNPLVLPYTFSAAKTFEKLLRRHEFVSFAEYFKGRKGSGRTPRKT